VKVRLLEVSDLPAVFAIEQQAMAHPWNQAQLREEQAMVGGVSLVAEADRQICGFAFFRTCAPESELLRLAVAPDRRGQGIGSALLDHALRAFAEQGYATCFLEVRSSNTAARRLYAKAGFIQIGARKKYYSQPVEDGLLLCRTLTNQNGGIS